jgi:pyruvyltransferase
VKLFWWESQKSQPNFGDAISPIIVEHCSGKKPERAKVDETGKLLACGSIVQFACDDDVIWGSGVHPCHADTLGFESVRPKHLKITAIRGPISRSVLLDAGYECPEIYGDPGVLLPLIYPEIKRRIMFDFGVMPHLDQKNFHPGNCRLLNVRQDPRQILLEMLTCKKVISASLHGIICAEAFGIPAIWLACKQGRMKYDDYYASTGRKANPISKLENALKAEPPPLPDLKKMQDSLLASFPAMF